MRLIGFDICNTLAILRNEVSKHFGIPLEALDTIYDYRNHGIPDGFWESPDGIKLFAKCRFFEGAPAMLHKVARDFKIVYVTARPEETRLTTKLWLAKHGFPGAPVIFANDKVKAVKELGIALMVEDAPYQIETLSGVLPVIAKDYSYNRHLKVPRFNSWENFPDVFDDVTRGWTLWSSQPAR